MGEDGGFKPGKSDPPGHVQWDWGKPEDVNGDGTFSQEEIGLWVVEFLDLDGDGVWHDYQGDVRDAFSPGDPFHTYKDENRNCKLDNAEKPSMPPGARRKSNAWGYMRQQAEMLMDEFVALYGMDRMATSAILPGTRIKKLNIRGNCPQGIVCWANSNTKGMVIAHELGHGWGLDHDSPVRIPGGALNLKEQRWIPEGESINYMYKNVGNNPRENFSSAARYQQLFERGLDGWNYFGSSSSAREPGGALLAAYRRSLQTEREATFALYGRVTDTGELSIHQTRVFHQSLGQPPQPGPYRLVFLNQEGDILSKTSFGPTEDSICDGCSHGEERVQFELPFLSVRAPYPLDTETVEIHYQEEVIHRLDVSLRAPSVSWSAPTSGTIQRDQPVTLSWNGADEDGDPLTYSLAYSPDGGRSFTPIATGLRGNEYTWVPHQAAGSDQALFRVTANDGFHTAHDQSPIMAVEKGAPKVTILSPQEGQELGHRSRITLEALAVDAEDGTLGGELITWTNEAGENFGSGSRITLDGYPQGEHSLTVSATDADGNQGSQTITLTVIESPPLPNVEINEDIITEVTSQTLAYGECEPTSTTVRATFPSDLDIADVTMLIDRNGRPGKPVKMDAVSGGAYTAEVAVSEGDGEGTWQIAVFSSGGFGEAWSEPSSFDVVKCAEKQAVDTVDEPRAKAPGFTLTLLLIGGLGALVVLLLAVIVYLLLARKSTK